MTNTETKYSTLIGKLRNAKPVDSNPDLLTDEIMCSISMHPRKKASLVFSWVRPLLTAAAVFLLGLFLYQQAETTNNLQKVNASVLVKLAPFHKPDCITYSTSKLPENRKLLNEYICYMKSNQAENENSKQFYRKYLPKNQVTVIQ
jgi:hypothetical protein